jgi:glycosyltransferase involved in cell wall biosynthesis
MRVVFVSAPPSDVQAQQASMLLEQAMQELCLGQQGYECMVLAGNELPGMLAFGEKRRQKQAIIELQPDLVIYASPANFLTIRGLRMLVLLTAGADAPENARIRKSDPKLAAFITDSPQLKNEISNAYGIAGDRISMVPFFEDVSTANDVIAIREAHTSGKEYFFYSGPIDAETQWERVLQAFSQFKKWQQSGLQLLLAGTINPNYNATFHEKLNAYKYRNDVITIDTINTDKNELLTAAFCVLSTAGSFNERMDIITAFNAGIPVIASDNAISKDLCVDSALFANFTDQKELSQQMISIYKNEGIYNHLVEKGRLAGSRFNRQQILNGLHRAMLKMTEQ